MNNMIITKSAAGNKIRTVSKLYMAVQALGKSASKKERFQTFIFESCISRGSRGYPGDRSFVREDASFPFFIIAPNICKKWSLPMNGDGKGKRRRRGRAPTILSL